MSRHSGKYISEAHMKKLNTIIIFAAELVSVCVYGVILGCSFKKYGTLV